MDIATGLALAQLLVDLAALATGVLTGTAAIVVAWIIHRRDRCPWCGARDTARFSRGAGRS